jgi:gliding motility-associated-like protein
MASFYNIYGQKIYIFWVILFLSAGYAKAATPFLVTGQCMQNPECQADSTSFRDTVSTAQSWRWDFGDGGTDTRKNPQHSYAAPGLYYVTLVRTLLNGVEETVIQPVTIGELPPQFQQWKTDTTICPGEKITLDPYPDGAPAGATYIWYPKGNTTQTLEVDSSGCYSVEVILPNGCKIQDRINVKICMEPVAQEGSKWFFGGNAGLDFSSSPPAPITDGKINTPEGTSAIANSKGQLLFYSDGINVYDKDGGVMPCNGPSCDPLKGSKNSTQSVLIVPQPTCKGCEYLFNIFTTSDINGEKLLTVSTVDMRQNGGKGAIIAQNTTLQQPTTERIASVRNDRDSTYWIVSHDYGTNKFRIFHATTGGLVETSNPALGMSHDSLHKAEGYMKFSAPDSATGERRLAVIIPGPPKNYVELFHFNDSTGVLTYDKTIDLGPAPPTAYGIEFSPDAEKMYISFQGGSGSSSVLKQYDLTFPDSLLIESAITIDSSATLKFGALQFASDGKIYMAIQDSDHLAVIGEPGANSLLTMEYERDGVALGGKKSQLGLPNMVQDFTQEASGPGFEASGFCTGEPTTFEAGPLCDPLKDSYSWNFDFAADSTAFGPLSEKLQTTTYTYTQPGKYIVALRQMNACADTITKDTITIYATPAKPDLPAFVDSCRTSITLDMKVEAEKYAWFRRGRIVGRERKLTVTAAGTYIAVAYNGPRADCISADTIDVFFRTPPRFTIGQDTTMCRDSSIVLTAEGPAWRQYLWNTGETTKSITVRAPGDYFVHVTDANDCHNGDTLTVGELPSPVLNLASEVVICIPDGGSALLDAKGMGTLSYEWSPTGETTQAITVNKQGLYTVTATNEHGCVTEKSSQVLDKCEPRFFIPDAFTPDGDANRTNEVLEIFGAYYTNFSMKIYNRWGEVIYATTEIEGRWDGTYKNVKVQPGIYPYVISYESLYYPERAPIIKRGSVMVIR